MKALLNDVAEIISGFTAFLWAINEIAYGNALHEKIINFTLIALVMVLGWRAVRTGFIRLTKEVMDIVDGMCRHNHCRKIANRMKTKETETK